MLFSSIPFLYYFLPLVFVCYFCVPFRMKNAVLLLFSLIFYSFGEPVYILLMAASIILSYVEGRLIEVVKQQKTARWILAGSCVIHLGFLLYFKYADFMIENLNAVGMEISLLKIALPIGISFYTFQILSYLVDVYRKDCEAQKNIISYGAYVSMFPQLIAGPIVRYRDIAIQLETRTHTMELAASGVRIFIVGLSKKVLIANALGSLCQTFLKSQDLSVMYYWLYAVAFGMQIYFDFSGYSDMAVGLGRIFGFHFPENFRYPFLADSITDFWRRWHMTLGSWFRDYVYIPMGGNRVSSGRWIVNIAVVWFLTGLWHGAAWNFVLWGMFFAVLLVIEKKWLLAYLQRHRVVTRVYVVVAIIISFVIFNAADGAEALQYLRVMFTGGGLPLISAEFLYYGKSYLTLLLIAAFGATPIAKHIYNRLRANPRTDRILTIVEPIALIVLLLVVNAYLIQDSYNPFLYFRF